MRLSGPFFCFVLQTSALALLAGRAAQADDDITHAAPGGYARAFVAAAAKHMVEDGLEQTLEFINYHGCTQGDDGKPMEMKKELFARIVHNIATNTDVRCVHHSKMVQLSGHKFSQAFGITKELRAALLPDIGGNKNMNLIVSKSGTTDCSDLEVSDDPGGSVGTHELFHVVLRNIRNDAFGGNGHKTEQGGYADLHHQLLLYLGLAKTGETTKGPWTKPAEPFDCGGAKAPAKPTGTDDANHAQKHAADETTDGDKELNDDGNSSHSETTLAPPPQ